MIIRPLPLLLTAIIIISRHGVHAQPRQEKPPTEKRKKQKLLGDIVFEFLDKNRDKEVTIPEMNSQILMLDEMANDGGDNVNEDVKELRVVFRRLRAAAPYIFNLLDQDEDRRLGKYEARYITEFEKSLNEHDGAREFVKEFFQILDDDVDDRLSADEILEGTRSNFLLGEIAGSLHQLFPLRSSPHELRIHIKRAMKSMWGGELERGGVLEGMKFLDTDNDQHISMKEIGDAYNEFGRKFLGIANSMKQAGPMMGMMGKDTKDDEKPNVQSNIRMDL